MANGKKNGNGGSTAIAEAPKPSQQQLPQRVIPAGRLAGAEQSDFVLPRIHIYQGLPLEKKLYPGKFEPGDLVNTITFEKLAERRFVPLFGWKEWICWREPRGSGIEYRTRNKADVPPADLVWDREKSTPPRCTEYINFACLFAGGDSPVVLSFARTMFKAGQTLDTLQGLRGKNGTGFYALETREKSNDKGSWLVPMIRPVGNPPIDMLDLVEAFTNSFAGASVETNVVQDEQRRAAEGIETE